MNEYAESILHLPGTAEEKQWLAERLEVLSQGAYHPLRRHGPRAAPGYGGGCKLPAVSG